MWLLHPLILPRPWNYHFLPLRDRNWWQQATLPLLRSSSNTSLLVEEMIKRGTGQNNSSGKPPSPFPPDSRVMNPASLPHTLLQMPTS